MLVQYGRAFGQQTVNLGSFDCMYLQGSFLVSKMTTLTILMTRRMCISYLVISFSALSTNDKILEPPTKPKKEYFQ